MTPRTLPDGNPSDLSSADNPATTDAHSLGPARPPSSKMASESQRGGVATSDRVGVMTGRADGRVGVTAGRANDGVGVTAGRADDGVGVMAGRANNGVGVTAGRADDGVGVTAGRTDDAMSIVVTVGETAGTSICDLSITISKEYSL
jgi:hypothetical protein